MNTPANTTNGTTNQLVISSARCVLLRATIVNNGAGDRQFVLADAASAPGQSAYGPTGLRSPRIPPGGTWTPCPVDSTQGVAFTLGCVFQSFDFGSDGNPNYTALSAATNNVSAAWAAPLA